jgi:lipopolysaccharide export system permease protein
MNFSRTHLPRILAPLLLAGLGAALCAVLVPQETEAVRQQLLGFPDSDVLANQVRPWILAGLCFLPALAALAYNLGGILDRYIVREFLGVFALSLGALVVIWLLIDVTDKVSDFRASSRVMRTVGIFYATRAPAIVLLLLPYSLLLALLFSMGKLSGNREIVAMVQAGRGVARITLPLLVAGGFFSLLGIGLNYQWAPQGEGRVTEILAEAVGKPSAVASDVLYREPVSRRLWRIGAFPSDYQLGKPLRNVDVTTSREDNTLESRLFAETARWDRDSHRWTFEGAFVGRYQPGEAPVFDTPAEPVRRSGWPETPWLLIKPGLSAAYLGIPELNAWLASNRRNHGFADPAPYLTQWQYRWALPFTCLITVMLATPLSIHFARRGQGGGMFLALLFSALLLLVSSISTALGESGAVEPAVAAWFPNVLFTLLALYLFRRRITGRPIYLALRRLFPGND